jgi:hypothetical protein
MDVSAGDHENPHVIETLIEHALDEDAIVCDRLDVTNVRAEPAP